jgi:hypothetical protein
VRAVLMPAAAAVSMLICGLGWPNRENLRANEHGTEDETDDDDDLDKDFGLHGNRSAGYSLRVAGAGDACAAGFDSSMGAAVSASSSALALW